MTAEGEPKMVNIDEEHIKVHIDGMVGDYISSSQEKAVLTARQKANRHVEEVRSRVAPDKLATITALYVANTNTPSVLGWKRYCLLHASAPHSELVSAWKEGGYSEADLL